MVLSSPRTSIQKTLPLICPRARGKLTQQRAAALMDCSMTGPNPGVIDLATSLNVIGSAQRPRHPSGVFACRGAVL